VLRKKLTDANAEAANYRTKLRETEAKLSSAKTLEEFEAATSELRGQVEALERQILLNNVAAQVRAAPGPGQAPDGHHRGAGGGREGAPEARRPAAPSRSVAA
jgi:hypothetical protein